MPRMLTLAIACAVLVISSPALVRAAPTPADAPPVRRFAFLYGANDGGPSRIRLRYAGSDAAHMARVLGEIGGVAADDVLLIRSSLRSELLAGLARIGDRVRAARLAGQRTELLMYYSGHSDENGLLLAGERLAYRELRDRIRAVPADVHVAVLDSCASGAFTRLKGGTAQPPFLIDDSSRVSGYAYISSSSSDEAAQESDRIAASYFTHALTSGLRGGADVNRDGKVTLNEAYQFAFAETVSRTESSLAGVQHPAYDLHLAGTGDVVITDLRASSATLLLAAEVHGRVFLRDSDGVLVVELNKGVGRPLRLGLGAGRYQLVLRQGERVFSASTRLASGDRIELDPSAFRSTATETAATRGSEPPAYQDVWFGVSLVPPLSSYYLAQRPRLRSSFNFLAGRAAALDGLELGIVANTESEGVRGVQLAGGANVVGGEVDGVQFAVLSNVALGEVDGVQIACGLNLALEGGRALQLGLGGNLADDLRGVQLAVGFNGARAVDGQLGLLNVAGKVRGLQLGLVNIAAESDVSVGLINLVGNGYHSLEAWVSDLAPANLGVKLGSRYSYVLMSAGLSDDRVLFGLGLGVHLSSSGSAYVDIDISALEVRDHHFDRRGATATGLLRGAFGWRLASGFRPFAGVQLSAAWVDPGGEGAPPLTLWTLDAGEQELALGPGLFVGAAAP